MGREEKTWWAIPVIGVGIWVSTFGLATCEPCKAEAGKSAVCAVNWIRLPDDYAPCS